MVGVDEEDQPNDDGDEDHVQPGAHDDAPGDPHDHPPNDPQDNHRNQPNDLPNIPNNDDDLDFGLEDVLFDEILNDIA